MPTSTLFRSEEMSFIQLYIPNEVCQPTVAELGELGLVQFRDLNPDINAFQRAFVKEIRQLDDMERQCRFFTTQLEKAGIPIRQVPATTNLSRARTSQEIDDLKEMLEYHEKRIQELNIAHEQLQRQYLELTEKKHVLRETAVFFQQAQDSTTFENEAQNHGVDPSDTAPLLDRDVEAAVPEGSHHLSLRNVTGVISRSRMATFERVLWRALRGNLYLNSVEIDEPITDPETDEIVEKNVFVIFAHGNELVAKIKKIAESLGATLYSVDEAPDQRRENLLEVTRKIEDLNITLTNNNNTRRTELLQITEALSSWITIVKKEKAIFHVMNLFSYDVNRRCLIAEGWCPTLDIPAVQNALRTASANSGLNSILTELRTAKEPPTYHRTNKFTEGFQTIIDAYGIAQYREVNPGLFTIISFPFLFAMMFGDVGHGILLLCISLWMVLNEKKLAKVNDEIFEMMFSGRYIMLLMAIFSVYTGLIYNDIFSRSMTLFDAGFNWPSNFTVGELVEAKPNGYVYPFGIDPTWHGTDNYLTFSNSYKMKQAIIIGVIHMSFAVVLNIFNYIYYGHPEFIWAEFIPQFLFMESVFGYLIICIIYKWSVDWWAVDTSGNLIRNSPPSLLNMLIYMFLTPGKVDPKDQLYPGQGPVQGFLILLALVCVPWMLLTKPYLLKREHEKAKAQGYHVATEGAARVSYEEAEGDTAAGAVIAEEMDEEEQFDFGEIMIHQTIHTIEFCLNCISNTASYLRLWALSLAHAQLSAVLWDMTLQPFLNSSGWTQIIGLTFAFYMWFVLTIFILLLMEGLSAFLHALRLHWVEFNNKFYRGTGVKFQPFSFKTVVASRAD